MRHVLPSLALLMVGCSSASCTGSPLAQDTHDDEGLIMPDSGAGGAGN